MLGDQETAPWCLRFIPKLSYVNTLANHSHGAMVRDAAKAEEVKTELEHRGFWHHVSGAASKVAQPFKSLSRWWKRA